jgi:hypothetical protein
MSHQLTVVLQRSAVPTVDAINQELQRLQLPCQLSSSASLESTSGSFPATVTSTGETRDVQFEDSDWLSEDAELSERAGDRDRCMDFLLGADMIECVLVSSVCAALSSLSDAIVYYQPDELFYTTDEIVAEALLSLEPPKKRR